MENIIDLYEKIGFSPVSASITEKLNAKGKPFKEFKPIMGGWEKEQVFDRTNISKQKNALFLVMGTKLSDGNYLIGFDVDNKEGKNGCKNGYTKWFEMVEEFGLVINTPTAKTGNNGMHYLFKISEELFNSCVGGNITDLKINDETYTIDVKCKAGCLIAEPTQYKALDGTIKKYVWTTRPSTVENIQEFPIQLVDIIKAFHTPTEPKEPTAPRKKNADGSDFVYEKCEITEDDLKLINIIPAHHFDDKKEWRKMMWIFKSVGLPFEYFDKLSAQSAKYVNTQDVMNWWKNQKTAPAEKPINIGLLHTILKNECPEHYYKLNLSCINNEVIADAVKSDVIKVSQRYLIALDNQELNDKKDILTGCINKFFSNADFKSLTLKSPYDTGKTKLIQKIITKFNPPRILWLSYRKTLTNDILGSFGDAFQFKDYQKGDYKADRLIIQLESIMKIETNFFEGEEELPSYDLVIIDEIESILSQFNSPTFKGNSKDCFNYIEGILHNSSRIIALDGDLGDRSYSYIKSFGEAICIENQIKINKKDFFITDDRDKYGKAIETDIAEGKKIVIVSMSSTECKYFHDKIKNINPELNVLIYTGSSSDANKEDLKNVLEIWGKCDVLLYSPTIEAGVNFDLPHFDKMYAIICSKSTTPRAFLQMLARVRKTTDNHIMVLNEWFDYHKMTAKQYYSYEEVKTMLMSLEDIKMTNEIQKINGKMCKINRLATYDVNYIYNKVEQLNANVYPFLPYLEMLIVNKGHSFKMECLDKTPKEEGRTTRKVIILKTEDITDTDYDIFLERQKKSDATEEEKMCILRHSLKLKLGIDDLFHSKNILPPPEMNDEEELRKWADENEQEFALIFASNSLLHFFSDTSRLDNFIYLIDEKNIPHFKDNQTIEKKEKARKVNKLIRDLGFDNVFDTGKIILKDDFNAKIEKVMKENPIFTDLKNTKILFGLNKTKDVKTTKGFLGFITPILKNYCISIEYFQQRINGEKCTTYRLKQLDCVNELVGYKIRKGMKLKDENNTRKEATSTSYKRLVDWEKDPVVHTDFNNLHPSQWYKSADNELNDEAGIIQQQEEKAKKEKEEKEKQAQLQAEQLKESKIKCIQCKKQVKTCKCKKISFPTSL